MDKQEDRKDFLGGLTVKELKDILKNKEAKVGRRKVELVERVIHYEENDEFGFKKVNPDDVIEAPPPINYKDVNASSPYPTYTTIHLKVFLDKYETTDEKALTLYNKGFIKYIRYSTTDTMYYVKASCKAELKKHMKYLVDVCFSMDREMQRSSCECPVGRSREAHCKHVLIVLIAIRDFVETKKVVTEEACAQKLQTFHQPAKKYTGSPMKAEKFRHKQFPSVCDEPTEDYKIWYNNRFRNLIISGEMNDNMSLKQLVEPANTYGVIWDHSFCIKKSIVDTVLESLHIQNVSKEIVAQIELCIRSQSESPAWKLERTVRLTASVFHFCCCRYQNPEGPKSLVNKIINPVPFSSKATDHGKIHEPIAVMKYKKMFDNSLEVSECGLFVPLDRPYLGATPDRLLFDLIRL